MIKVGLIASLRGPWHGGVNYYHNLLDCYQKYPDSAVKLDVFTPFPEDVAGYQSDAIEIHPCSQLRRIARLFARNSLVDLVIYDNGRSIPAICFQRGKSA